MEQTKRRVVVVIPTLNEAITIERVLKQLSDDLPANCLVEFVVVDGGSTDGTPSIVGGLMTRQPNLQLLHNPHRIQSTAVNLAVRTFGHGAELLVRCDAHADYPIGFVRLLVETYDSMDVDSIVVPMDTVGTHGVQAAVAMVSNSPIGTGGAAHRGGTKSGVVDHGHHALFRLDSFRRAGTYDETFTHNEDAEFDCRLRAIGGRIFLNSALRIRYYPRSTFSGLWRQYYNYGKGRARTVRRHPGSLRLRQLLVPSHIVTCALGLAVSPWFPLALAPIASYVGVLAISSLWFTLKRRRVAGLLAGSAALTMHCAWAGGFIVGLMTARDRRWRPANLKSAEAHFV